MLFRSKIIIPSVLISYGVTFLLKIFFKVPRPCFGEIGCPSTYSFPSGHASVVFAWLTSLFYFKKKKSYLILLPIPLLVIISRVGLGVHTWLDVIVGSAIGTIVGIIYTNSFLFFTRKETIIKLKREGYYIRKLFHILGILFVFSRIFLGQLFNSIILGIAILIYSGSEVLRLKRVHIPIFHTITKICAKRGEAKDIIIAPILFMGGLLILNFFDQLVYTIGSIALIIGDGFAGLIGKHFGKHKVFWSDRKSWEGFSAFAISTFFYYLIFLNPVFALALSIVGAFLESLLREYDNLFLPIVMGFLIKLFTSL